MTTTITSNYQSEYSTVDEGPVESPVDGSTDLDHQISVNNPAENFEWENRAGLPMDSSDVQRFVDKSETYGYQQELTISNDGDLTAQEAGEAARDSVADHFEDAPSRDYIYSVEGHSDGTTDVSVVMTGERDEMWMDKERLDEFHDLTESYYEDMEGGLTEEQEKALMRERIEQDDQIRQQIDHEYHLGSGRTTDGMAEDYGIDR